MIRHDHIAIDGDTAWWVVSSPVDAHVALDRPCDTCGGKQRYDVTENGRYIGWQYCTDCDTGRHAFAVEVEEHWTAYGESGTGARTLRVSVVPDMVMPIYDPVALMDGDGLPEEWMPHVTVDSLGSVQRWWRDPEYLDEWDDEDITLPPAAKPGMWAIQLRNADR